MSWLYRLLARIFGWRSTSTPQAIVHVHNWDICRTYGQYRYRICLNGCGQRLPC